MKVVVYDVETLAGCFTYTDYDIHTGEIKQFVIHPDRNELDELYIHLKSLTGQIGFNNLAFDYGIIHLILVKYDEWLNGWDRSYDTVDIINDIYSRAQELIGSQFSIIPQMPYKEKDMLISQMDLFRIWHFNNPARSTSLKSLQIAMNYPNVEDMPIHHNTKNISTEDIENILSYNLNDVLSTYEFYKRSKGKIDLRKGLIKKYGLKCLNYPDSKIGEELTLKLYCEATGLKSYDVKKLRTEREIIHLRDCIFPYIKFKTPVFNEFLEELKTISVKETNGAFKKSIIFKRFQYDYGLGGIHGCIKAGVYEDNDEWIIIDADVGSMYPSIAIVNKLYPLHLGEIFCEVYENGIVVPRLTAKKAGDSIMADGFKLSANSVYGKSNDKHSFMMDPFYTMCTTLNGQLMLTMLCEKIVLSISDVIVLQVNTDGFTIKMRRSDLDKYYKICKQWEKYTNLTLEYAEYSKMVIRDVNNYLALYTNGKIKHKGAFEIDKDYHKDTSFRIIPLAVSEYFVNGIPVEETIKNHTNIYDFCGRQKFKRGTWGVTYELIMGDVTPVKQQHNVRYYMSQKGHKLIKHFEDGRSNIVCEGQPLIIFNKYVEKPFHEYEIDYQYYIRKAYQEIRNVENNQLSLF